MTLESMFTELLLTNWGKFTAAGVILFTLKICRLPKVKGWFGEKVVDRDLKKLNPEEYHVFHDIYLPRPDGKGTTQVDHLVVSRFGLFVIETKNYKGWVFGGEKQRQWTQLIYKVKHKFQNPLHQNALHINALRQSLNLDKGAFHNLIFFIGNCTFKTDLPPNVMTHGLIRFIKKHQSALLTTDEVQSCLSTLEPLATIDNKRVVAKNHVQQLRKRQIPAPKAPPAIPVAPQTQGTNTSPPSCPKCAQPMVEHIANKGTHAGNRFWGCAQFPKCRGTGSFVPIKN